VHVPAGAPVGLVQQGEHLAAEVFAHGFVDALRPTLTLPIVVLLCAATCTLAVRRKAASPAAHAVAEMDAGWPSVA